MIHISGMNPEQWAETTIVRLDGKREFRERPKYGNRHVVFLNDSEWGEVHVDEHNALDFPTGTVNHLSKYTEEKTSIPQNIAKFGIVIGVILVGAEILQTLGER